MGFDQIKVELCDIWGSDRNAAESAWASSFEKALAEAKTEDDVRRVITGVVKLHHDTPKERVWMELFMTFPIYVERQFDKYRMTVQFQDFEVNYFLAPFGRDAITQNELSGRYRTIPERYYRLPPDVICINEKAPAVAKTGWAEVITMQYHDLLEKEHRWYQLQLELLRDAEKAGRITNAEYKRAREVLRGVLGTAYITDMRVVLNMNAFEHIVNQRLPREAQMESRVAAYHMIKTVEASNRLPVMLPAMIEANGWKPLMQEVETAIRGDSL